MFVLMFSERLVSKSTMKIYIRRYLGLMSPTAKLLKCRWFSGWNRKTNCCFFVAFSIIILQMLFCILEVRIFGYDINFLVYLSNPSSVEMEEEILLEFFDKSNQSGDNEIACKIPRLNPFAPSIAKYIRHPKDLSCSHVQPELTYVDYDGYLKFNRSELSQFSGDEKLNCTYFYFDRANGTNDFEVAYDDFKPFHNDTKLTKSMVQVRCSYLGQPVYHNIHAHPVLKENSGFKKPTEKQLSLLYLFIDSVSYSSFRRNLRETEVYTTNVMGMKYLKALNKVGSNSFPNMLASLTGYRVADEQPDMLNEINGVLNWTSSMPFDDWPLVWKKFSKNGYATVFIEDNCHIGLFHYEMKGFAKKPFDFYYHPFCTEMDHRFHNKESISYTWHCFQNKPLTAIFTDLVKRHLVSMQNTLQYIHASTSELSHDHDNQVERVDSEFASFFKEMYEGGYLNKTAIIFASDHGIRFGKIRSTFIGKLEESLPFYGIYFPPWFYALYPNIEKNLNDNMELLSSSFDTYQTLMDILNGNYNGSQRNYNSRSQSQLYPLLKNRTCKDAGIPDMYCACLQETVLNIKDKVVVEGANFLVDYLNWLVKGYSKVCRKIFLKQIKFAKQVSLEEKFKIIPSPHTISYQKKISIGIITEPFGAVFEALLKFDNSNINKNWAIVGDVIRTSRYEGLSNCVNDKKIRWYCSCKNVRL